MADVNISFSTSGDQIVIGALRQIGAGLVEIGTRAVGEAIGGLAQFAVSGVAAATSLGESLNKVNVVFGDSAAAVQDFARSAARSLGQSEQQALEAVGTYGNLLTSIGLMPDTAAEMSMSLTTLASDLASFNNALPEEALIALRAALTGEFEPMKRFGAALSADAVTAKALAMGLAKVKDELTPAMRAQATYALIMEQTTNAQGDFARTSTGLANTQRTLRAQWTDLQAQLGQALVPTLEHLGGVASTTIIPALGQLAGTLVPALASGFSALVDAALPAMGAIMQTVQGIDLSPLLAAFGSLAAAIGIEMPTAGDIAQAAIAAIVAGVQMLADFLNGIAIPAIAALVTWVAVNWPTIRDTVMSVMRAVESGIQAVLQTIQQLWAEWGDEIMAVVNFVAQQLNTWMSALSAAFAGDWYRFGELLREGWDRTWAAIVKIVSDAIAWFGRQDWGQIGADIVAGIGSGIQSAARGLSDAAVAAARAALDAVRGFLGIRSPSMVYAEIGRQMMAGMSAGIQQTAWQPAYAAAQVATQTTIQVGGITIQGAREPSAVASAVRAELERVGRRADQRLRLR